MGQWKMAVIEEEIFNKMCYVVLAKFFNFYDFCILISKKHDIHNIDLLSQFN